jgi:hypothetical protein
MTCLMQLRPFENTCTAAAAAAPDVPAADDSGHHMCCIVYYCVDGSVAESRTLLNHCNAPATAAAAALCWLLLRR